MSSHLPLSDDATFLEGYTSSDSYIPIHDPAQTETSNITSIQSVANEDWTWGTEFAFPNWDRGDQTVKLYKCTCNHLNVHHSNLGCMIRVTPHGFCPCDKMMSSFRISFRQIKAELQWNADAPKAEYFEQCLCGHNKVEHVIMKGAGHQIPICFSTEMDPCMCTEFKADPQHAEHDLQEAKELEDRWQMFTTKWKYNL